jgi:cobalt-zinc-cadmium efflux system outer membrane protein
MRGHQSQEVVRMRLAIIELLAVAFVAPTWGEPSRLVLTADEAVERALFENAEVAVRAAELAAAQAEAKAAGRPPPLTLSLSPATIWEQLEAAVSAVLDISGRRKWASRAARHELAATVAGNEEFRLELAASTRSSYWRLCVAQERMALAGDQVRLAEELQQSTTRLVAAGVAKGVDRDRSDNELAEARLESEQAQAAIRQAQTELATLLQLPPETEIQAADRLPEPGPGAPRGADLQELALASRPALRRVGALVRAALARAGVAGAERYPDLEFSLEREEELNFGRALLELPLIDFGTIKYGRRAARARAEAALIEVDVVEAEIRQEVQSAADTLSAARTAERRLREELIPRQEDIVSRLQHGYEARSVNFLDVLEAQTMLQELRAEWLDAVMDRLDAHVRLERALGVALEEIENADHDN